jgi:3-oxoacyl-[acyl-carrier protein] reductase
MPVSADRVSLDLSGHVAIITGANHGIGAATAEKMADSGASVFLAYLRLPVPRDVSGIDDGTRLQYAEMQARASGEDVAALILARGGRAGAAEADLSRPEVVPRLFDLAEEALGPVDIVINNADHCASDTLLPASLIEGLSGGGDRKRPFTAESFDAHAAVNSRATGLMMAELARRHVEAGREWGRIVNLSSDGAPAFEGEISYGATKYAAEAMSRAAALELGPLGVTVNVVSPGPIQTGYITAENMARIADTTPLRRVGMPDDVADVIRFLCSEHARWLTGQVLYVGGGWRMW